MPAKRLNKGVCKLTALKEIIVANEIAPRIPILIWASLMDHMLNFQEIMRAAAVTL